MEVIEKGLIFSNLTFPLQWKIKMKENGRKKCVTMVRLSRKKEESATEISITQKQEQKQKQKLPVFPIKVSNTILPRAVVAVLGLGFIDAGYSGDWSRIGVISKEAEDLLKLSAFVVVPLCIFLIYSFSKDTEN